MQSFTVNKSYLLFLSIVASLGGFLFGYDTAVISGTIGFVSNQFNLDPYSQGWYVSCALVGCVFGVSIAGYLSDKFGRKYVLIFCSLFFFISAFGCMIAFGFIDLVIYRIIGGIAVGMASMLSPLYISEISPAYNRGKLVALYQFAITIGILISYIANAWLLNISQSVQNPTYNLWNQIFYLEPWRSMLGSETLPAALFFILLFFVPESPRWMTIKGRENEALQTITKISNIEEAKKEIEDIKNTLQEEKHTSNIFKEPGIKLAIIIGATLGFLTQVSGINAIIYYGPEILNKAGFGINSAFSSQVIIGIINVAFTLIAIWKIDSFGRRPLLLFGVSGIVFSLIVIGFLFALNLTDSFLLLLFILIFIACFAFSFGPVIWVLLSEIYPTSVRGRAMSIGTLTLWVGTALVGQMVPIMLNYLTPAGTFWAFAIMCFPAIPITLKVLPETKGKTLEEIENYWLTKYKKH